jgi:hypothetical protein
MSKAVRGAFFVMWNCARRKELVPPSEFSRVVLLPLQMGQPGLAYRLPGVACHSWPASHSHQNFFPERTATCDGRKSPFLDGCHWLARSGRPVESVFSGVNGFGMLLVCRHSVRETPCYLVLGAWPALRAKRAPHVT